MPFAYFCLGFGVACVFDIVTEAIVKFLKKKGYVRSAKKEKDETPRDN